MIARGLETTITKSGKLPFNLGFDANHCSVFVEMSTSRTLNLHMEKLVPRTANVSINIYNLSTNNY